MPGRRAGWTTAAALAAVALSAAEAAAQQPPDAASDWSFAIGGFGTFAPEYEGAGSYAVSGFPIVELAWRDLIFLSGRDGLGVYVLKDRMAELSASVGYSFGRDEDDSDDLAGLGDVDGGAVAILDGSVRYEGFSFSTRASYQFTGDDTGVLVEFGPGYGWRSEDGWFVNAGIDAAHASGAYMDAYFGVSAAQAGRQGLAAFDAGAGIKSVGISLAPGYAFDENWSVVLTTSYDRLVGDAADSPITRSADQFSAGLGISWRY